MTRFSKKNSICLRLCSIFSGSTDLDVFLLQTEPMMARVAEMRIRLEKQKVHLCETCYESGVVKSQGIPVLTCITALRDQTAATKPVNFFCDNMFGLN